MKSFLILFAFLPGVFFASPALALESVGNSGVSALENVDAFQAVAIANDWRWSRKELKSSVNSREVVFQFPDGTVKKIPLPTEKMVVALAPYIQKTHK